MARSRNIKPAFFSNDILADIEPLGRLLFIGLWTIADYKGDFELRVNRIKAQILPYDNCDVKKIMINLDLSRFITTYNVDGVMYGHITNFTKHQNPHPNEKKKGSDIPEFNKNLSQVIDFKEVAINHDKSRQVSEDSIASNADSLILIPDSCSPITDSLTPKKEKTVIDFDVFWKAYPKGDRRADAKKKWKAINLDKQEKALSDCQTRYLNTEKQFIPAAVVYLNGRRWEDDPLEQNKIKQDKHSGFENRDYSADATPIEDITWTD